MIHGTLVEQPGDKHVGLRHDLLDGGRVLPAPRVRRSEEHTSELQSRIRISYAVF